MPGDGILYTPSHCHSGLVRVGAEVHVLSRAVLFKSPVTSIPVYSGLAADIPECPGAVNFTSLLTTSPGNSGFGRQLPE